MPNYEKIPDKCRGCAYLARYYVKGAAEYLPVDFGKCVKRKWGNFDFNPFPEDCGHFVPYSAEGERSNRKRAARETIEEISETLKELLAILEEDKNSEI